MTAGDLLLVVLARLATPVVDPGAARAFSAFRRRVDALPEAADALRAYRDVIPIEDVTAVHRRLTETADKLARVFRLPK